MKKLIYTLVLAFLLPKLSLGQNGNYGALAIDKKNGFFYGWAVDFKTRAAADNRALKECRDRGGNCSVVLRFSGGLCAEYRTINENIGTAYGWGVAKTKAEASRIANSECGKRSNGTPCDKYVWGCNTLTKKPTDDFWSGKETTKKPTATTPKKDDFWSGGKAKTPQSTNKTDFWTGSGTKEEEKKFEENTKADDSDQYIGNVRSRTNRIRIFCRDSGQEDGDLVRISNNDQILKDDVYLTTAGKSYWFELKFGQNKIEILALNQGTTGANTAEFKVYDDNGNELAEKSWHLETGYKGKLLILKL